MKKAVNDMNPDMPGLWDLDTLDEYAPEKPGEMGVLCKRFVVPPFTVLDARQGYWQRRKKQWLNLGITSEIGRGAALLKAGPQSVYTGAATWTDVKGPKINTPGFPSIATSIFDPVLCEVMYRWYCPAAGWVVDPFAGGSVRGIVAATLGLTYYGVDLDHQQILANEQQARDILGADIEPRWILGDSRNLFSTLAVHKVFNTMEDRGLGVGFDFAFTCPPYGSLESYTDNPRDLSTMTYPDFLSAYEDVIIDTVHAVKHDRFIAWVVGDYRDVNTGLLHNLPGDTVELFRKNGCQLFNDHLLVTMIGSAAVRVSNQFPIGRKAGRTHQHVYVFCKGDAEAAVSACAPVGEPVHWVPGDGAIAR